MWKLASMLAAVTIVMLALPADEATAQLPVTCGGAIQKCPEGKEMFCNRWRPCKGGKKKAKVPRYCGEPVCMTKKSGS